MLKLNKTYIKENLYTANCVNFQSKLHHSTPHWEKTDGEFTGKINNDVACQPHQYTGSQPLLHLNNANREYCMFKGVFLKTLMCLSPYHRECGRNNQSRVASSSLTLERWTSGMSFVGSDATYAKQGWKIQVYCLYFMLKQ